MKSSGILNAALSGALARLGHTDQVLICDSGMPCPREAEIVDLAFLPGIPAFADVVAGILAEIVVEGGIAAEEVVRAETALPWCQARCANRRGTAVRERGAALRGRVLSGT